MGSGLAGETLPDNVDRLCWQPISIASNMLNIPYACCVRTRSRIVPYSGSAVSSAHHDNYTNIDHVLTGAGGGLL